ncbi:MAG TPA: hypothetical protein VFV68_03790 [Agriterribacter sp.]|nr:hypothetical protein [Agriterribacter sp.]
MTTQKIKHMAYESESWKRALGFILDENVYLKNKLSETLKENFAGSFLNDAEDFQNSFIYYDTMISIIRDDIAGFDRLLEREAFENGKIMDELVQKAKTIRDNMMNTESAFSKLKSEFSDYLLHKSLITDRQQR